MRAPGAISSLAEIAPRGRGRWLDSVIAATFRLLIKNMKTYRNYQGTINSFLFIFFHVD